MRRFPIACVLAGLAAPLGALAASFNLYEWMATAPVVVVAEPVEEIGRRMEVKVLARVRGDEAPGATLLVELKKANRGRDDGAPALKLAPGKPYLLLLEPSPEALKTGRPVFGLVRGTAGGRPLPEEGSAAWIDAAVRLASVQDRHDEAALWRMMAEALDDPNPVLLDTALEMFVKFKRCDAEHLPSLRSLLSHPRAEVRARAAGLAGEALARQAKREGSASAGDPVVLDLVARARSDENVEVRVAATRALGLVGEGPANEALKEIARDDPDQNVRYEAGRILLERGEAKRPFD